MKLKSLIIELKRDFEDRFNALLYKVEKGQINSHIDKDDHDPADADHLAVPCLFHPATLSGNDSPVY